MAQDLATARTLIIAFCGRSGAAHMPLRGGPCAGGFASRRVIARPRPRGRWRRPRLRAPLRSTACARVHSTVAPAEANNARASAAPRLPWAARRPPTPRPSPRPMCERRWLPPSGMRLLLAMGGGPKSWDLESNWRRHVGPPFPPREEGEGQGSGPSWAAPRKGEGRVRRAAPALSGGGDVASWPNEPKGSWA